MKQVGVVGFGQMGTGIAQVTACAGYPTLIVDADEAILDRGMQSIRRSLEKLVSKDRISSIDRDEAEGRLTPTRELTSVTECDLVVEAVTESLELKRALFQQLDSICKSSCIMASNTSSLSITQLMTSTQRPERFVGLHFFNPVPIMKLVEVVETVATDAEVYEEMMGFTESLGKTPVRCQDRTGFMVNRLLIPYLLDAVRAFENGTGSMDDIDTSMKLGCGHPMGPFQLMDFIGLDTIYHIANILFEEFRESRMAPPPILKRLVYAGRLGRKTGRGFYQY